MFADESCGRVVFRLAGANKKYIMKIIFMAFFVFLFLDSAGAVFPSGFNADGDPSEWGPSGFLTGDWSVNDTWVPNPGILFVVEDNYNPKQGGSYTGVHIQGNGSNYVFYDEPMVKNKWNRWVWEPYGREKYDIEAMYFTQDDNYVYFLVVTSQNPNETYNTEKPGDLRIDVDKTVNSTDDYVYELGVKLASTTGLTQSHLYEVSDWHRTTATNYVPQNYPTIVVSGTDKGAIAGFAYTTCSNCNSGTGSDINNPIYIMELKISKSNLGLSSGSYANPEDFSFVTGCTNESIRITDVFPPSSISNLQNTTYFSRFINWTWTDPADGDFSHVMVYLNGVFQTNVSAGVEYYFATGLNPETSYTISTRTVDASGNINQTWVNHTATTAPLPDEVWVDDDWAGSSLGQEVEAGKFFGYNAFDVIQDGVDNVSVGGTVYVRAGTYYEMVTITKSLTLLGVQADVDPRPSNGGRSGAESVIDAYGNYSAVFIDADNVVVNGFEITNATGDMINQTGTHSGTVVKYNYVHDSASPGDDGVQLKHCTNCIIEYNYFENVLQDGASISSDSADCAIRYNEINGSYSENAAIFTYRSTNISVIGNLVYNVYVNDGIKVGDYRYGDWNYGGVVRDNVVHDGVEDGITIYASDVVVEFNEIYNCLSQNGALHLYNATNAYVKCNKIHDNQANGTLIEDSLNVTLINNDIYNNYNTSYTTAGIWTVGDVRDFSANYNNIYNNSDYGFYNGNSSLTVNAENNWWGDASGPSGAGSGSGDAVSNYVDYNPWLSSQVVACAVGAPSITSYSPTSPVSDTEGATRTFSVTVDQTVNVYWYLNGTLVQTNTSVTSASYTNTSAAVGYWNITAVASNANGEDVQTWFWSVSPAGGVTDYISFWKFEENIIPKIAYDESAKHNDGSIEGDVFTVAGKYGNAFHFDGSGDYIEVSDSDMDFDITSGVTWTFWIKTTSTTDKQDIICKYNNPGGPNKIFEIGLRNNGQYVWMYLRHQDGSNDANPIIRGNTVVNDGQWHHIAITYDPSTGNAQIYVDGNLDVSETMDTGNIVIGSESLYIGVFPEFTKYYNGELDDVRVYNRILTNNEINDLYNGLNVTGYISYWKFEESMVPKIAYDESAKHNDASIGGDVFTVAGKYGNAFHFDGSGDYIEVDDSDQDFDITTGVTWTFWMKTTSTVDKQDILCKYVPTGKLNKIFEIGLRNNGQYVWMYLRHQDGSNDANPIIRGNTVVNDGQWHHIAITYDPSTGNAQIYVDGNLDVSETMDTGNIVIGSENLNIGLFTYGEKFYNGDLDDVRIYNRVLTNNEINDLYNGLNVTGYISYWKFEENIIPKIAYDESAKHNDGSIEGDVFTVAGKYGNAFHFDGSGDYIEVSDSDMDFDITSGVTWTFWIKTTSTTDKQDIICKYNNPESGGANKIFEIGLRNNGQYVWMYLRHQDGSNDANPIIRGNTVVNDGQWHHIAITYDPSTGNAQIYVDGNLDVSETMDTGNIVIGSENLNIGVFPYGFAKYYNGVLDEVRIYDRVLTSSEINDVMNSW